MLMLLYRSGLRVAEVTRLAKPAAPITLTHIPNGADGHENLTTPGLDKHGPASQLRQLGGRAQP